MTLPSTFLKEIYYCQQVNKYVPDKIIWNTNISWLWQMADAIKAFQIVCSSLICQAQKYHYWFHIDLGQIKWSIFCHIFCITISLFILINPPYGLAGNTVLMYELLLLVTIRICWKNYKKEHLELLVLHLLLP